MRRGAGIGNDSDTLYTYTELEQLNGWWMMEATLLVLKVTDKQGEEARMNTMVMDWNQRHEYQLLIHLL